MNKSFYKKSIMAMLFVLIYIAASTAVAQILPLSVLQDLTNSNIKRRILYDAIQAAAVIPFAATYFRSADFREKETYFKWIPWVLIGVCAILVTIILPERVYAFWFYLIIVGCGEEFVFRGYLRQLTRAHAVFRGAKQRLAALSSLVGVSPPVSSALPAAVYPSRKTPKDLSARLGRCLQGRGRRLAGASQGR